MADTPLSAWRKQHAGHGLEGLQPQSPGRKAADPRDRQIAHLQRDNARLHRRVCPNSVSAKRLGSPDIAVMSRVNYFVRFRDNYDGRLRFFGWLRFFLVFPPVTVAINLKDRGMVDDSVDGRYGHQGVWEDLVPMAKRLV